MHIILPFFALTFLSTLHTQTEAQLGVCYGMIGDNLPSKQDVIKLYKSNNIKLMRIYDPDVPTLDALKGSGISLVLGVPNEKLQSLATDQSAADEWVKTYVAPYAPSIKYITAGNEIHPSYPTAQFVALSMQNILTAINSQQLDSSKIKVTTAVDLTLIKNSYPPSAGEFGDMTFMSPIVDFLKVNDSPLLVNVYTYFAYVSNKKDIPLDYALGDPNSKTVVDPNNGLVYKNLFDAEVDAVYAALEKAGAPNTRIVVSETGWPSDGGDSATVKNSQGYYGNMVNRLKQGVGTPRKPGQAVETYLFAMFDENKKPNAATERHFGLFSPNMQPKYQLSF